MKLIDENTIEDLNSSLGLGFLPEEKKKSILTEILKLISKEAGAKIMKSFSEQDMEEFNKIPKDDFEKMEDFLISKNSESKKIFDEEAEKIKKELLDMKIQ